MSQYDRGYYEATAARDFQEVMNAAADISRGWVESGNDRKVITQCNQALIEWKDVYDEVRKRLDEFAGQQGSYYSAIKIYRPALQSYYQSRIFTREKVNADVPAMPEQMGVLWGC